MAKMQLSYPDALERLIFNLINTPFVGMESSAIALAKEELGYNIPYPLQTFYLRLGGHSGVMAGHARILAPCDLYIINEAMVFCEENQNVMFFCVQLEDCDMEDPPVKQGNEEESSLYSETNSLSGFLLKLSCWQAINWLPFKGKGKLSKRVLSALRSSLWTVDGPHIDPQYDMVAFCESGLVVYCFLRGQVFYVASYDQSKLNQFEKSFKTRLDIL